MKLVASLIVRNELGRYLEPCIRSLLEFVDEIRILDDCSTDGWDETLMDAWGDDGRRVHAQFSDDVGSTFFRHEGQARQRLLEWTLAGEPTHILAIDADEFVADGRELRKVVEEFADYPVVQCCMVEVWNARPAGFEMRTDGGWDPHPMPTVYRVPEHPGPRFRIQNRALACGREPMEIRELSRRFGVFSGVDLLHFGWTNIPERIARHDRYVVADGGKFHASRHLDSILWPDRQCQLVACVAPGLRVYPEIVERANRPARIG